jgi:hypothetical protein
LGVNSSADNLGMGDTTDGLSWWVGRRIGIPFKDGGRLVVFHLALVAILVLVALVDLVALVALGQHDAF